VRGDRASALASTGPEDLGHIGSLESAIGDVSGDADNSPGHEYILVELASCMVVVVPSWWWPWWRLACRWE